MSNVSQSDFCNGNCFFVLMKTVAILLSQTICWPFQDYRILSSEVEACIHFNMIAMWEGNKTRKTKWEHSPIWYLPNISDLGQQTN